MKTASGNQNVRPVQVSPWIYLSMALALYTLLAAVLYGPYLKTFTPMQFLAPGGCILGACGCFLLSRRWLASFDASAVAGAVYGFGPFLLSFGIYRTPAVLIAALLPWLFCPTALWKEHTRPTTLLRLQRMVLLALPFAAVFAFFWLPAQPWSVSVEMMPATQHVQLTDLFTLLGLPFFEGDRILIGLYAVSFILCLMGLFVYLNLLRIGVLLPVLTAVALSFAGPLLDTPPIIWIAMPMLFAAVLAGFGAQAFAWAGPADAKWILLCLPAAVLPGAVCWLKGMSGTADSDWLLPAVMYLAASLMTAIIFILSRTRKRWHLLRFMIIWLAAGIDLILSGKYFISRIFF